MLDYTFGPDSVYLEACTYGPDSMALLDMMQKAGVKPIVCFVNYHTGSVSEEAEKLMKEYCTSRGLTLETCDAKCAETDKKEEKAEDWGREIRYNFFASIYEKYHASALFLAHQEDDLIETYLLIKHQGAAKAHYGFNKITSYRGMMIVRPLLNYSKEDLLQYCQQNKVPFSAEITNFEDTQSRDELRNNVISKLNEVERDQLLSALRRENDERFSFEKALHQSITKGDELNIREILAFSPDDFATAIIEFVNAKASSHCSLNPHVLSDIRKMCLSPNPNMTYRLKDNIYLVKEYDTIGISNDGLDLPYCYVIEKPSKFSCPTFDLDFSMGAEDRNIHAADYPITVRSVLPQDVAIYGGYLMPVRKALTAAGISSRLLRVWPVFLNQNGKVIYVPRYRKGFSEYHSSILNIHVKDNEK